MVASLQEFVPLREFVPQEFVPSQETGFPLELREGQWEAMQGQLDDPGLDFGPWRRRCEMRGERWEMGSFPRIGHVCKAFMFDRLLIHRRSFTISPISL